MQLDQSLFNQRISTVLKLLLQTFSDAADQRTVHALQELISLLSGRLAANPAAKTQMKQLLTEQSQTTLKLQVGLEAKLTAELETHQITTHASTHTFGNLLLQASQIGITVERHGDAMPAKTAGGVGNDLRRSASTQINHQNLRPQVFGPGREAIGFRRTAVPASVVNLQQCMPVTEGDVIDLVGWQVVKAKLIHLTF